MAGSLISRTEIIMRRVKKERMEKKEKIL